MARKNKSDLLVWISSTVAVCSLLLNALQFYDASREQERKHGEEQAERAPEAFYAYGNDQTLMRLYGLYEGRIALGTEPGMSDVSVRHGSGADQQIQAWLAQVGIQATNLRNKPIASFLVIGNRQDHALRNLRVLQRHGQGVADSILLSTPVLGPKKYLLVPLDFRAPGNDSAEPDTPSEVLVEYGDKPEYLSVRPSDRIDWLGTQFLRGLVRSPPDIPAATH